MTYQENVIKGLECVVCPNKFCGDCLYFIRNEDDPDTGWCNREAIYKDALSLLKAQEQKTAYWIPCNGKSHIFYCSQCAEKVNYNNAHRVYNKNMKPIEQVNKFCRGCGYKMIPRPTDKQQEKVKWE